MPIGQNNWLTGIDYFAGFAGILVAGLPEVASGEVDDFTGGIPLPGPGLPPGDGLSCLMSMHLVMVVQNWFGSPGPGSVG